MTKVNREMRVLLREVRYWVLATADSNRIPNAVPIHFCKVLDNDRLMLVNNYMKKTINNINENPNVSVSVWEGRTGYQFKGTAKIETSGVNFEAGKEMVKKVNPKLNSKGVVIVDVDSIYITSPGSDAGKKVE